MSAPSIELVVGILGFLTALITNIDRVQQLWNAVFGGTRGSGKWTGICREYGAQEKKLYEATDRVNLRVRGSYITGSINTTGGEYREWKVIGQTFGDGEFITLTYVSDDEKKRCSGGAIVMRRVLVKAKHHYLGYWLGFDPNLMRMVSYPYVLTELAPELAKQEFKDYMSTPMSE